MSQDKRNSSVRISHSLNEAELDHVTQRRAVAWACLSRHGIPCSPGTVPRLALLGSGGGERAMLGLLGSLLSLAEEDLLDVLLYLSGVSGSTWCMAALYKEPDWSSKLDSLKNDLVQKLCGDKVHVMKKFHKLQRYYEKDNFSLTDVWAALVVSTIVKEIDEQPVSHQRSLHSSDPYPIYTVMDAQSSADSLLADTFFEITPHEAGYSITGAFVKTCDFGSQFSKGQKTKDQPEMDMLFLQGLCGSVFADRELILEKLLQMIKRLFWHESDVSKQTDALSPPRLREVYLLLLNLLELNLLTLRGEQTSTHIHTLNELLKGRLENEAEDVNCFFTEKNIPEQTQLVCRLYSHWLERDLRYNGKWMVLMKCLELVVGWIWGSTYNYLYRMEAEDVSPRVLTETLRRYQDAGLFINSPYFSALREERRVDLILSLDFSEEDPFETIIKSAAACKELRIAFPDVRVSEEDKHAPGDFYVFEGHDSPTVIHIPLFNTRNCKGEIEKWKRRYKTFQPPYGRRNITDLLEKASENIRNNKVRLLSEIQKVVDRKNNRPMMMD